MSSIVLLHFTEISYPDLDSEATWVSTCPMSYDQLSCHESWVQAGDTWHSAFLLILLAANRGEVVCDFAQSLLIIVPLLYHEKPLQPCCHEAPLTLCRDRWEPVWAWSAWSTRSTSAVRAALPCAVVTIVAAWCSATAGYCCCCRWPRRHLNQTSQSIIDWK